MRNCLDIGASGRIRTYTRMLGLSVTAFTLSATRYYILRRSPIELREASEKRQ